MPNKKNNVIFLSTRRVQKHLFFFAIDQAIKASERNLAIRHEGLITPRGS